MVGPGDRSGLRFESHSELQDASSVFDVFYKKTHRFRVRNKPSEILEYPSKISESGTDTIDNNLWALHAKKVIN